MTTSNIEVETQRKNSILGGISIAIAVVLALFAINFIADIIPLDKLEGIPLIMSVIIAPVGISFGYAGRKVGKSKLAFWGIISNSIMFAVPILYLWIGTAIEALLSK